MKKELNLWNTQLDLELNIHYFLQTVEVTKSPQAKVMSK